MAGRRRQGGAASARCSLRVARPSPSALWRRFRRRWWIPASVGVVVAWRGDHVCRRRSSSSPLFNDFDELPNGELRSEVLELADRAGVDVGEVYRVDASRRTTGANAYVAGLGHTKRVVLYDNLIEDFTPAEVRSVVAHELGHVKHDDVPRGLLFLALIAPPGMLLVQRHGRARWRPGRAGADLVPALALALAIVSFGGQVAGSYVSRGVEARADAFALRTDRTIRRRSSRWSGGWRCRTSRSPDPPDAAPGAVRDAPDDDRAHRATARRYGR